MKDFAKEMEEHDITIIFTKPVDNETFEKFLKDISKQYPDKKILGVNNQKPKPSK